VQPDSARELKARILAALSASPPAAQASDQEPGEVQPRVAVGLTPAGQGLARVAIRLEKDADRALLPDLGRVAEAQLDVRVIGPVRALSSPAPGAGTLGGFVRVGGRLAVLSNNHVLAAGAAAQLGDPCLQPGPADGGTSRDRVGSLTAFQDLAAGRANLVDAAVAALDPDVAAEPGDVPGGPLSGPVPDSLDIDPDELVEKVGRTTGHTHGRITAVEVDGVAVSYDDGVYRFDDQIEIVGRAGSFSQGGDSGSVIWRSRDRAPLGLLFAGSSTGGDGGTGVTFANPLSTVLSVLGADWVAD
jgi:hypothetical protein